MINLGKNFKFTYNFLVVSTVFLDTSSEMATKHRLQLYQLVFQIFLILMLFFYKFKNLSVP